MKTTLKTTFSILALSFFVAVQAHAQASQIDWGTGGHAITGNTDVNTDGTVVDAFVFGGATVGNVTVNGVTFQGLALPSSTSITFSNYALTSTSGNLSTYSNLNSSSAPFTALSPAYQTLLTSGGSAANPSTLVLTLGGLTVGQQYVFQFWTSNSPLTVAASGNRFASTASATAAISLTDNMTNTNGDLGQFGVGTFTAANTSETVTFSGMNSSNDPLINAFQLRALPVPEPATSVLLGLGLLAGSFVARRYRSV